MNPRRSKAELKAAGLREDGKDPQEGRITDPWARWLVSLSNGVNQAVTSSLNPISVLGSSISIPARSLAANPTTAGIYRLSYYARITVVDAVSSSLTVTLNWTDHGVAQTFSGAAMTGNTVTTYQTNSLVVYIDSATAITGSTAYSSNTPGQMKYELYATVEAVSLGLA